MNFNEIVSVIFEETRMEFCFNKYNLFLNNTAQNYIYPVKSYKTF